MRTLIRGARVVTPGGGDGTALRGAQMRAVEIIERADVLIEGGVIAAVGTTGGAEGVGGAGTRADRVIEAKGRVLLPGFVDCHTHACFAGDRTDEWLRQMRGESYLDILRSGGGIMATVRAVRGATEEQLAEGLLERLRRMLAHGSTTIEVKSGYGLSAGDELKMLRAIRRAAGRFEGTVSSTALLGHALDPAMSPEEFVERTIGGTLAAVSGEFPGIAVDAYCEKSAWSVEQCERLFARADALGHPVRVHTDQFSSLGMIEKAIGIGARSVDHLEASTPESVRALGAAVGTLAVVLPVCGLHLGGGFAPGRGLIDAGAGVAVATNFNPGSAPCPSMQLAAAMGVRGCGLSAMEAIVAATANPAAVLGLADRGRIRKGQRADLVLLSHTSEAGLVYEVGANAAEVVIAGGEVVWECPGAGVRRYSDG